MAEYWRRVVDRGEGTLHLATCNGDRHAGHFVFANFISTLSPSFHTEDVTTP